MVSLYSAAVLISTTYIVLIKQLKEDVNIFNIERIGSLPSIAGSLYYADIVSWYIPAL